MAMKNSYGVAGADVLVVGVQTGLRERVAALQVEKRADGGENQTRASQISAHRSV